MSKLESLIEKLSKSSPEAVNTLNSSTDEIIEYLHIETDIEERYLELLKQNKQNKCLIFLCGSSGDGKSAIINRHINTFKDSYNFHVDATHSFKPNQTAIEALTESFKKYQNDNKSLVIGINIGIMLNFTDHLISELEEIQKAIKKFLDQKKDSKNVYFINFENYSKFNFQDNKIESPFIKKLLNKITIESDDNPFFKALIEDNKSNISSIVHQNYRLLSNNYLQNEIINLLILSNLKYDQFLTIRSLLDFIYILLKGPNLLVNQIFEDTSNDIIKNIKKEDPILKRSFLLDKFILERFSSKKDDSLNRFIDEFNDLFKKEILDSKCPFTLIRTFFIFKEMEISNNYHKNFLKDFDNAELINFVELISIHRDYREEHRKRVKEFYEKAIKAIYIFINKNYPDLVKKSFVVLSSDKELTISAYAKILPNWNIIKSSKTDSFRYFPFYLKINGEELEKEIHITLNMYLMINLINNGYRPNKHDRNTIIIFEELIESVLESAVHSDKLAIIKKDMIKTFSKDEDEIEVDDEI